MRRRGTDRTGSAASQAHTLSVPERAFRLLGGGLNFLVLALTVLALVHNLRHAWLPGLLPSLLLAFAAATFAADLVSGTLHWAFDTWFSTTHGAFNRMVAIVREHHVKPDEIFTFRFAADAGMLSWFGGSGALAALLASRLVGPTVAAGLCLAALVFSADVSLMFEYHKWGHRRRRGRLATLLQRCGLLLAPEHHLRHHRGAHDSHYCLINGMADRTLGRLGYFRGLERLITALTGVPPRAEDHAVLGRLIR